MGWSAVCDCGNSWSYSLNLLFIQKSETLMIIVLKRVFAENKTNKQRFILTITDFHKTYIIHTSNLNHKFINSLKSVMHKTQRGLTKAMTI